MRSRDCAFSSRFRQFFRFFRFCTSRFNRFICFFFRKFIIAQKRREGIIDIRRLFIRIQRFVQTVKTKFGVFGLFFCSFWKRFVNKFFRNIIELRFFNRFSLFAFIREMREERRCSGFLCCRFILFCRFTQVKIVIATQNSRNGRRHFRRIQHMAIEVRNFCSIRILGDFIRCKIQGIA